MVLLNDISFEKIKDNFYYGKFENFTLVIDKNTLCFNATKLCRESNKDFKKWIELERTQELINYYKSKKIQNISYGITFNILGEDELNKIITGEYIHRYLLFDIASWISPEFYFNCFDSAYHLSEGHSKDENTITN